MGDHRTFESLEFFKVIQDLGETLGYIVKNELPISNDNGNKAQAIDICWFVDEISKYPIMIFEIESKNQASIANNPLKIFGKPNEKFQKPLFFFHILLGKHSDSERIEDLKRNYGLHNYRLYEVGESSQRNTLITDVLEQHRRIKYNFNIIHLINHMKDNIDFWGSDSIEKTIKIIEEMINWREEKYLLQIYSILALEYKEFKNHFLRRLEKILKEKENSISEIEFNSSFVNMFVDLFLYAIAYEGSLDNKYYELLIKRFKNYAFNFSLSMGTSYDHSQFLVGMSGSVISLFLSLTLENDNSNEFFCGELDRIVQEIRKGYDDSISIYNSLWLLQISSLSEKTKDIFEKTRIHLNSIGGVSIKYIYSPPVLWNYEYIEEINFKESPIEIDEFASYRKKLISIRRGTISIADIAHNLLQSESYMMEFGNDLLSTLVRKGV